MLELHNIVKKYGSKRALDDVSLTLPRGEIVGLFGENGARYILKVISTISAPTSTGIRA